MTGKSIEQTLEECDSLIAKVISSTNLDRVFFGDREEARQYLRMIVIERAETFGDAPAPLRWVILYRRALDEIYRQQGESRRSFEGKSPRPSGGLSFRRDLLELPTEPRTTPEQLAMAREVLDAARREIEELAPRERRILDDYAEGVSSNVTAGRLGISGQRVRQIVSHVLGRIRTKI